MPLSETVFNRLEDPPRRDQRTLLIVFGCHWELLGTSKNLDSVQYILKKSSFQRSPLPRHFLAVLAKRFGVAGGVFGGFLGPLLSTLFPL